MEQHNVYQNISRKFVIRLGDKYTKFSLNSVCQ
jgi:hypothetical protein